ncbi:MAG TPA: response regulator [Terriglobales bacterium]
MSILLADDDVHLATFLSKSLESEGYRVRTALDEASVLSELKRQSYRLIILDLNFGPTDGLQLLQKLRAEGLTTPVLVLSARDQVSDRIESLKLGADDYVTKPFSFQELSARASAILRRKADPSLSVRRVEDLEMDPITRRVHRGAREVKLSPREFELLQMLMRRAGEAVTRQHLLEQCWGSHEPDSNLVDVYVNYLRKKIDVPGSDKLIHTVRGAGYRLGRPAPAQAHGGAAEYQPVPEADGERMGPGVLDNGLPAPIQLRALRTLIHSMVHDLAQPLTSVRCFLEMIALTKGAALAQPAELKTVDQQADRAVALAKGISAMVREIAPPTSPWITLETLFHDVLGDFAVVEQSGLLRVEQDWESSLRVSSSPMLRQLLIVFLSKIVGRNAHPLVLNVGATAKDGRVQLDMHWRLAEPSPRPLPAIGTLLTRELGTIQAIVRSLGGKLALPEGQPEISLTLPTAPAAALAAVVVH